VPVTMARRGRVARFLEWFGLAKPAAPTFAELVWIHRRWRRALEKGDLELATLEETYRHALARFERAHGRIIDAYWCSDVDSAAALTERRAVSRLRKPRLHFHRASNWATKNESHAARLLHRCDVIAIKAEEVLRGSTHRICMQLVMAGAKHLLALVDKPSRPDNGAAVKAGLRVAGETVSETEAYYKEMSLRESQIVYVLGMLIGLVAVAIAAGVAWSVAWGGEQFFACAMAGSIGGIASVVHRMSKGGRKFELDPELGRGSLHAFGALRTALGATFGLTLYFALASGFINLQLGTADTQVFVYALIAFAGGFSERLAKDVIDSAEKTVADAVLIRKEAEKPAETTVEEELSASPNTA
jgi:hypothetical protein